MSTILRVLSHCLLAVVFLLSVVFSFFNSQPVPLSLGFMAFSAQPLALWLLAAFALGGLLGLLLGSGWSRRWRKEREIAQLHTRITSLEQVSVGASSVNRTQNLQASPPAP